MSNAIYEGTSLGRRQCRFVTREDHRSPPKSELHSESGKESIRLLFPSAAKGAMFSHRGR